MSVFIPISKPTFENNRFWEEAVTKNSKIISKCIRFKENCSFLYKNSFLHSQELILSSSYLFFYTGKETIALIKIKWCLIESFYEEMDEIKKYGFTVSKGKVKLDFYTETPELLDAWMENLSYVAIMNDFEENFIIIKPIDSGQFGVVYLCEEVETKELFALKKIQKTALQNKKNLNLLFNEISILRKIDHPNIIRLFKVFEDNESVSLMMEYVPYGNLYNRINKKRVYKEKDALIFARNLLDILAFLHKKGIIHRDIKCENILMTSKSNDFEFKLADFGLACYAESAHKSCSGSPGYMAPEMLRGYDYNAKADVFSAGVIFHIILYGAAPFEAKSISKILKNNAKCKIDFEDPGYKTASYAAVEVLQNILIGDPALRPSAEQALMSPWLKIRKYSDSEATSTTIKVENVREKQNSSFSKMVDKYSGF